MEQRKTNKKKLVVALALLALIVVASVITTVVLVLAAGQQRVSSNVNVTYSVTDVSATIKSAYLPPVKDASGVITQTSWMAMDIEEGFDADEASSDSELVYTVLPADADAPSMSVNDETSLYSTHNFVVYRYTFVNNGDNGFKLSLSYTDDNNPTDANVAVASIVSTDEISSFADVITVENPTAVTPSIEYAENWTAMAEDGELISEYEVNDAVYVYVIVEIVNTNKPASFNGAFAFDLVGNE